MGRLSSKLSKEFSRRLRINIDDAHTPALDIDSKIGLGIYMDIMECYGPI